MAQSLVGRAIGKIPNPPSTAGKAVAFTGVLLAAVFVVVVLAGVVVMVADALGSLEPTL